MNQDLKNRAKSIFESSKIDALFVNKSGHFFTSRNLALNSVRHEKEEKDRKIEEIKRDEVVQKTAPKTENKLLIKTADGTKLCFVDLVEGDTPKVGDKAKIGNKNADGVIKIDPQLSYKFEKSELKQIIENKA